LFRDILLPGKDSRKAGITDNAVVTKKFISKATHITLPSRAGKYYNPLPWRERARVRGLY